MAAKLLDLLGQLLKVVPTGSGSGDTSYERAAITQRALNTKSLDPVYWRGVLEVAQRGEYAPTWREYKEVGVSAFGDAGVAEEEEAEEEEVDEEAKRREQEAADAAAAAAAAKAAADAKAAAELEAANAAHLRQLFEGEVTEELLAPLDQLDKMIADGASDEAAFAKLYNETVLHYLTVELDALNAKDGTLRDTYLRQGARLHDIVNKFLKAKGFEGDTARRTWNEHHPFLAVPPTGVLVDLLKLINVYYANEYVDNDRTHKIVVPRLEALKAAGKGEPPADMMQYRQIWALWAEKNMDFADAVDVFVHATKRLKKVWVWLATQPDSNDANTVEVLKNSVQLIQNAKTGMDLMATNKLSHVKSISSEPSEYEVYQESTQDIVPDLTFTDINEEFVRAMAGAGRGGRRRGGRGGRGGRGNPSSRAGRGSQHKATSSRKGTTRRR